VRKWVVGLAAVALLATACGSSSKSSGSTTPSTGSAGSAPSGAASSGSSAPSGGPPIKVLGLFPTSGALETLGSQFTVSAKAGASAINASGGILGRQVEFTSVDTQSSPTVALSELEGHLSGGSRPDLVFCSDSNSCLAVMPTLTREKIPVFSQATSSRLNNQSTYPYFFGLTPDLVLQAGLMLNYLKAKYNVHKVDVVTTNDPLGSTVVSSTQQAAQKAGVAVSPQYFNETDVNLTPVMQKVKDDNPDAIITQELGAQIGYFFTARSTVGLNNVPVVGTESFLSFPTAKLAPQVVNQPNTVSFASAIMQYKAPGQGTAAFNAFYNTLQSTLGAPVTQSMLSYAYYYDALQYYKAAAEQAKSLSPPALQQSLLNFVNPSNSPFVLYSQLKYSPTEHFPIPGSADFVFLPIAPFKDGMIDAQAVSP
jgi:branched-chain amino acid transport system substrate-binding protein